MQTFIYIYRHSIDENIELLLMPVAINNLGQCNLVSLMLSGTAQLHVSAAYEEDRIVVGQRSFTTEQCKHIISLGEVYD